MSLVQYPDSDSDDADSTNAIPAQSPTRLPKPAVKRKLSESVQDTLPPLPAAFHDLYSTNARASTNDDPSLHGGRKRAMPHVEGNWPSHVYLEWVPSQTESDELHSLIQHVRDIIAIEANAGTKKRAVPRLVPSLESELGAPIPLHVSLSRTLQIKTKDKETFIQTLKSCLRRAAVRSFSFEFARLRWVPNFERNRWFLVLDIKKPAQNELNRLLVACNEAAELSGHPGLYTGGCGDGPMDQAGVEPIPKRRRSAKLHETGIDCSSYFHISIAWNLEEPDLDFRNLVTNIDVERYVSAPQLLVDVVKTRIGNVVHNIDLDVTRT